MGVGGMEWIDVTKQGPVKGSWKHGNKASSSVQSWEILEWLVASKEVHLREELVIPLLILFASMLMVQYNILKD